MRPFVGYVTTNPISATANPDGGKIPVRVAKASGVGPVPGTNLQSYANNSRVFTTTFSAAVGFMHKFSPAGATFAYTLPAITLAIDGMALAVVNVSTGSTATVAAPTGSDNIGNSAGTATGATAAGPAAGLGIVYTADNTQKAWLVGI